MRKENPQNIKCLFVGSGIMGDICFLHYILVYFLQ